MYKKKDKNRPPASTADEAIKTMLAERKLSSKINYDVLRGLKAEDEPSKSIKTELSDNRNEQGVLMDGLIAARRFADVADMPVVYESGPTRTTKASKRV